MAAAATIVSSARGRTRFRVASRRRDDAYFSGLERALSAAPEVERVEVNPITGSVLVHHHGDVAALTALAGERQLFEVSTLPERPHDLLRQQASAMNRRLQDLSGQSLDLRSLALLLLLALGLGQLMRGQFAAPAVTVFWYAAALLTPIESELR
jgi:hypothetical protein